MASEALSGLTEGRIVHYVLENGQHRPAIVVRNWNAGEGQVNLQVFTDGLNDGFAVAHLVRVGEQEAVVTIEQNVVWRTSVHYSEEKEPDTWHWIEKA